VFVLIKRARRQKDIEYNIKCCSVVEIQLKLGTFLITLLRETNTMYGSERDH